MLRTITIGKGALLFLAGLGLLSAKANELASSPSKDSPTNVYHSTDRIEHNDAPVHQNQAKAPVIADAVRWQCTPFITRVGKDVKTLRKLLKAVPNYYLCQDFDSDGYIRNTVDLKKGWWVFARKYGELHIDLKGDNSQPKTLEIYLSDAQGNRDMKYSRKVQTSSNKNLDLSFKMAQVVSLGANSKKKTELVIHLRCRAQFKNNCH